MRLVSGTSGVTVVAVVCALCCTGSVRGQNSPRGQNSGQDTGLPVESSLSLDPLIGLLGCLRDDRPGYCFQKRALGYFESWMTSSEDEDDDSFDGDSSDGAGEKLPAGISPKWSAMLGQVAEKIADSYGGEEEEDEEADAKNDTRLQKRDSTAIEDGRGHKKKKIKAIKKALIKLVLIALLIKSKLKILLTAFQTFLGFKGAVLVMLLVITHAVKLWAEIKHHQHPQKVIYYENAHHQHHYDHHDHDDHHGGWNLWGRSGEEASSTPSSGILSYLSPMFSRRNDAVDLPYSAYSHYDPAHGPPDGYPTTDKYYRSLPTTDRVYRSLAASRSKVTPE